MDKMKTSFLVWKKLPKSLLKQPIWLAYYFKKNKNGTLDKPPVKGYSVDEDKIGKTFKEVVKDGFPGIKINKLNNIVAFDIDDKEAKLGKSKFSIKKLSKEFRQFITKHNSYTEVSPSKCGLRILFYIEDKTNLPGRASLNKELCLGGEFYANSGYVTITGQQIFGSGISTITAEDVIPWFELKKEKPEKALKKTYDTVKNLPAIQTVYSALEDCKLDQSSGIKRAYKHIMGQSYSHYDFWLKILCACHNYAQLSKTEDKILSAVLDWSKTDSFSYQSEEDVITHWSSLDMVEESVTYHTLFKFARLIKFRWPQEKFDKKGNPTGKPLINDVDNFDYLMKYYNLEFYYEAYSSSIYVSGDSSILNTYFKVEGTNFFFGKIGPFDEERLKFILWRIAQRNHYDNIACGTMTPLILSHIKINIKQINLLQQWLETSYEDLPIELKESGTDHSLSTLDYVMSCMHFNSQQSQKLAQIYLKAFFFGIVMPIYNPQRVWPEHNFMLVLTGPENCHKSSFLASLMPSQLRDYLITRSAETLNSDKSVRDLKIQLASSALLIVDEFELFYSKKNDAMFKNLVTCDSIDYVPIYSKTTVKAKRNAALASTTNKRRLPLEQDSSRRVAMIDVTFMDTNNLMKVNWHVFYSNLVKQGKKLMQKKVFPWKLTQEDINLQYQENEKFRSRSDLEHILREIYDFDSEFPGIHKITVVQTASPYLETRNEIIAAIKQKYPETRVKLSALVNILEQMCGKYSRTSRKLRKLNRCEGTIQNGIVRQKKYTKYVMPPKITNFIPKEL